MGQIRINLVARRPICRDLDTYFIRHACFNFCFKVISRSLSLCTTDHRPQTIYQVESSSQKRRVSGSLVPLEFWTSSPRPQLSHHPKLRLDQPRNHSDHLPDTCRTRSRWMAGNRRTIWRDPRVAKAPILRALFRDHCKLRHRNCWL